MNGTFEEKVAGLRQELSAYSSDIVDQIRALNTNYVGPSNVSLRNDPLNALQILKSDVREVLDEAADRSEYLTKYKTEINECTHMVNLLSDVGATTQAMTKAADTVTGSDLSVATSGLLELQQCIANLTQAKADVGAGKVCVILRKESHIILHRFLSRLRRLLSSCIQVETGCLRVASKVKGLLHGEELLVEETISLSDVWKSLVHLGAADSSVTEIVRHIWRSMIVPLWKEKRVPPPRVARENSVAEMVIDGLGEDPGVTTTSTLACEKANDFVLGECRMPFSTLLETISKILEFTEAEVFCGQIEILNSVFAAFQSDGINLNSTLSMTLTALIPSAEADLASFSKSVEKACLDFEDKWGAYMGLEDGQVSRPLSSMVENLPQYFARTRRKEVLGKARELVLADYHNTMMASGDAAEDDLSSAGDVGDQRALMEKSSGNASFRTLRFEPCQVSLAACRLLKLLHEVMKQACGASPKLAHVLYQSCRDCLELFIAIVPMKFSDSIETMPRMGAVFYNDCVYIAHNTTIITHMYRKELMQIDASLGASIGMVDFIPRFRLLGESCLANHLEEQREVITELVRRIRISPTGTVVADPFDESENDAPVEQVHTLNRAGKIISGGIRIARQIKGVAKKIREAHRSRHDGSRVNDEDAAVQVSRHIERLGSQWRDVLQESVYCRLMGYLIECAMRAAMKPILVADTIGEAAGTDISRILRKLQVVQQVFPARATGGVSSESEIRSAATECASWRKFCALADLLEYSLSEIAEQLPRLKFSSFTGAEMCSLVKALFEDTPKRQGIVTAILEMSS